LEQTTEIPITTGKRLNIFKRILLYCLVISVVCAIALLFLRDNILAFILPVLPLDDGKTAAYYLDLYNIIVTEFGWTALVIIIAYAICDNKNASKVTLQAKEWAVKNHREFAVIVVVSFASVATTVALFALNQFPNSSDEYVYLYQAQTVSDGRLWYPASPVEEAFRFNHIAEKDGIRVGRFPPGWPLLMAIFLYVGVPAALVNIILGVLALFVFYRLALRLYGPLIATAGMSLLGISAFYIFNSASYFSHTSCVFEALVFTYGIYLYIDRKQPLFALMAGAALGLMLITRYYTAVLIGIPLCVMLFYHERLKSFKGFFWLAVGALPFFIYLLWYNYSITGDALEPVTVWAYDDEGLGFVNGHTLLKGLEHIMRRMLMFAYWVSPVMLLLYFVFLFRKRAANTDRVVYVEDYFFIFVIIGYLFYHEIGGNQYGPRFYFEAFPFLLLLVLRTVFAENIKWAKALIIASAIVMIVRLPLIAHREHMIVKERTDVYRLVAKANIQNAVIFVANGTSVRRPMPASDLTRNDIYYQASVLYAFDDAVSNNEVMKHFADRTFYRYVRRDEDPSGVLIKLKGHQ